MYKTKEFILKKETSKIYNTNNPGGLKGIDKIIIIFLLNSKIIICKNYTTH